MDEVGCAMVRRVLTAPVVVIVFDSGLKEMKMFSSEVRRGIKVWERGQKTSLG